MMIGSWHQFYIPDAESMRLCERSRSDGKPVTVSGVDYLDGKLRLYRGVVQTIEDYGHGAPDGRRWRVTMRRRNPA